MAEEPYMHQDYPKHLYHPNGALAVVTSPQEEASLGEGWHDSPAGYGVETCPAMPLVTTGGYQASGYQAPASYQAPMEMEPAERIAYPPPESYQGEAYQPEYHPSAMPVYPVQEPIPPEAIVLVQQLEEEAAQRRRGRPPGSRTTPSEPSGESHE